MHEAGSFSCGYGLMIRKLAGAGGAVVSPLLRKFATVFNAFVKALALSAEVAGLVLWSTPVTQFP